MSIAILSKVEDQIQQYFNSQNTKALAESTKSLYHGVASTKLVPYCMDNAVNELDDTFVDHLDDYTDQMRVQGVSAHTIRQYLTITKIFFTFHGIHLKYTYKIPREDKKAYDRKRQDRWFSDEEIALCKTYTFPVNHTRNHLLIRLFCDTGARINEIANIKICDIKNSCTGIFLSESKTMPRDVTFGPETVIYLKRHLEQNFSDHLPTSEAYIFPGKNMIYKIVIQMLRELGLKNKGDGRGPHTFRHWTATYLHFTRQAKLSSVAFYLGDKPETISSRYLHPNGDILNAEISKASGW